MSLLLLDVGNSRVKWSVADGAARAPARAVAHGGDPASALADIQAQDVTRIRVANVTGASHATALAAGLRQRFGCDPEFAASEREWGGLRSAYAEPQRLGIDRWLGLIAAWSRQRGAACVVSCGTALTFDAIDAGGRHLGGIIAPGLRTAQQAVLGATRFASSAAPEAAYAGGLGASTEACVREGALHACAGLVDRLAARQIAGARYLTGGDAAELIPHLSGTWTPVPDLVLEGLHAGAQPRCA